MRVERVASHREFSARAAALIGQDEVRHTVMLGVLQHLRDHPDRYPEHYLWLVVEGDEVEAAALMTVPFHLLVARPRRDEALAVLAGHLRVDGPPIPGVNGALPEAQVFADAWAAGGSVRRHVHMQMRLHQLEGLQAVPAAPGGARPAVPEDHDIVLRWWREFAREAGLTGDERSAESIVAARLATPNSLLLWEDGGEPVSMAGASWSSPGVARVGPVYTPPGRRRAGYATSLVASLTERLLAAGAHRCLLYTDLANPTSNSIYARVGYQGLLDAVQIDFEPVDGLSPSPAAPR